MRPEQGEEKNGGVEISVRAVINSSSTGFSIGWSKDGNPRMYALKIENGKERIRVRSYASAFIPSYTSAAEDSMGKRLFVVPGYIFLPKMISGAEKVPPTEWNVIEALSDSHPSTFNTKQSK